MLRMFTAAALLIASTTVNAATISFGPTSAGGNGPLVTFSNLAAPTTITDDATINFTVRGDLNSYAEYIDISLDSFSLGRVFDDNTDNDPFDFDRDLGSHLAKTGSATIANSVMSRILADGFLNLSFDFSRNVNANGSVNHLEGTITYNSVTPVPLPASGLLLIAGVGGIAALRRKKKA